MDTNLYINGFSSFTGDVPAEWFSPYIELRRLRRMEKIVKNTLFCSFQALEQAGLSVQEPKNMGLCIAAGAGSLENTCKFMDSIFEDGDELSSPTAFAGSVHNSTGLALSMHLNIQGPCVTIGQFESSFPAAIMTAVSFLQKGCCEQIVVAVADEVNPVAADYAPKHMDLFRPLLRNVQGPFERFSAALVLGRHPQGARPYQIKSVCMRREKKMNTTPRPICFAQQLVDLLKTNEMFSLQDIFCDTQFNLEATPYVKP